MATGKKKLKRSFSAETIYKTELITSMQLSPDGKAVVYAVQHIDRASEKKYSNLWLVGTDGSKPRQLTYGNWSDVAPKWSPDGSEIAFLSSRSDKMQLYCLPMSGGEARPVTSTDNSIEGFEWSPDGTQLALLMREPDPEAAEREKDPKKKELGIVRRHITKTTYKFDAAGFLPSSHSHLWLASAKSGKLMRLTRGKFSVGSFAWSPDGLTLAFVANTNDDALLHRDEEQIYAIAVPNKLKRKASGTKPKAFAQITEHEGSIATLKYSPDGESIAFLGSDLKGNFWQNTDLYVVSAEPFSPARNLSKVTDFSVGGGTINDVHGGMPGMTIIWSDDGSTIYTTMSKHGDEPLVAISVANGAATWLIENEVVGPFGLVDGASTIAYLGGSTSDPGNIRLHTNGASKPLTQHNKWIAKAAHCPIEEVWYEARDGYKLQGWIMTPPGFDAAQQYPSIMYIHGGPQAQYGNWFFHEFQFLAEQGFVVFYTNPRGGQGYGSEHCHAIHGQWGTVDFDDLMDWADFVSEKPYIDTSKMGVAGGSYGGYMTSLIIGRTNRFAAASAQRNVTNWTSMYGTADFNHLWTDLAGVPAPWEDIEINWAQSPMSHIGNAKTPTQVIHSEHDYRTNLEQSEQLYVALKVLGVDTELIIFPNESHGLSRMGRTDRRVARLEHIATWFNKYLKE